MGPWHGRMPSVVAAVYADIFSWLGRGLVQSPILAQAPAELPYFSARVVRICRKQLQD